MTCSVHHRLHWRRFQMSLFPWIRRNLTKHFICWLFSSPSPSLQFHDDAYCRESTCTASAEASQVGVASSLSFHCCPLQSDTAWECAKWIKDILSGKTLAFDTAGVHCQNYDTPLLEIMRKMRHKEKSKRLEQQARRIYKRKTKTVERKEREE